MIRRPPRPPLVPYTSLSRPRLADSPRLPPSCYSCSPSCPNRSSSSHERAPELASVLPHHHAPGGGALHLHARQGGRGDRARQERSEEHTSELQSQSNIVCRL